MWPVQQGCLLSLLLYVLALEPLLHELRDGTANLALRGILFAGCVRVKVSAYADITVFLSSWSDIKAVKKAVKSHEEVAGAKINFDKSEGLRQGAWRGDVLLPECRTCPHPRGEFQAWLQLERNWLEVRAKVEEQVSTWLRMYLSLKGRAEVCTVYIFSMIFYRLSVLPLSKVHQLALI